MARESVRQALERMIAVRDSGEFERQFAEFMRRTDHSVRRVSTDWFWLNTFNCYAYAFGLVGQPRYRLLYERYRDSALLKSRFVSTLLSRGELRPLPRQEAASGAVVLYSRQGKITHAGLVISDQLRIRSKFGPCELYEHGLREIPSDYGRGLRFYAAPDPGGVLDLLERILP